MIEIKVPNIGESISEATLAKWLKKDGDYVEMDEVIAELESEKATFELNAEKAGVLKIVVEEGTDVSVGDVICQIDDSAVAPEKSADAPEKNTEKKDEKPQPQQKEEKDVSKSVSAGKQESATYATGTPSPAAAKMMREEGVATGDVKGSGKDGRITKEDVLDKLKNKSNGNGKAESAGAPSYQQPQIAFSRETRREKMSKLRQTISRRLVSVKNETAMLTTFNDVDMTAIMELRTKYKEEFKKKHEVNLGFMSFFSRACSIALQKWPAVNGRIEEQEIVFHDYADIAIAVSTPRGLVVPIIRNAESLSLAEIERIIVDLATRARDNKLSIDEMQGGTFTITNGGVFGSLMSTPIINGDQSAILGMHRIEERPVALNGQVVIKPMMYLALSYDHRIVDGRESVGFLKMVKELLENPVQLLTQKEPLKLLLDI